MKFWEEHCKGEYEPQCLFIPTAAWIAAVGIKEWPAWMMTPVFAPNAEAAAYSNGSVKRPELSACTSYWQAGINFDMLVI